MTQPDPVFARLATLPGAEPSRELSESLRRAAHARLRPRRVHPAWAIGIALCVVSYLSWAVSFSGSLYQPVEGERELHERLPERVGSALWSVGDGTLAQPDQRAVLANLKRPDVIAGRVENEPASSFAGNDEHWARRVVYDVGADRTEQRSFQRATPSRAYDDHVHI
jgi:hypothetical protein